ncbi:hypothetical protein BH09MYX1_BH09MYX1_41050 [soil metagenome]
MVGPHRPLVGLVTALALAAAAACSGDGSVKADASTDAISNDASDAALVDAATDAIACTNDGGAATWTQLYSDYFGPSGKGQCGKASGCHLDATGGGQFWVCGSTKESCFQGMRNNVIPCNAVGSRMPDILRKANDPGAPGKMPQDPTTVTYDDGDVAKISSWINAGAKND